MALVLGVGGDGVYGGRLAVQRAALLFSLESGVPSSGVPPSRGALKR